MSHLIGAALIGSIIGLAVAYLIIMLIVTAWRAPKRHSRRTEVAPPSDREFRRVRLTFPNLGLDGDETTELITAITCAADVSDVSGKKDGYLTITLTTDLDRAAIAKALGRHDFDFDEATNDGTA